MTAQTESMQVLDHEVILDQAWQIFLVGAKQYPTSMGLRRAFDEQFSEVLFSTDRWSVLSDTFLAVIHKIGECASGLCRSRMGLMIDESDLGSAYAWLKERKAIGNMMSPTKSCMPLTRRLERVSMQFPERAQKLLRRQMQLVR